jgi:peptide/nickel transport system ATP-binding protein
MRIKNVKAVYAAGPGPMVKAVDDVSLNIRKGEVLGIAGESGCGKSTLAAVIALTARPPLYVKGGSMELDGEVIQFSEGVTPSADWHGKLVALLPQRALNSLNPTARVRDFVVDVMRAHDPTVLPQEAIEAARVRLKHLSLPPRVLDSYPHQLSGGMRQRTVAVISTLLDPKVLIADEPTSALDVSSQKQLIELLKLLLQYEFITRIAFITHDLPMLSNIADRIAVMYAGKLVEVGDTEQIVSAPRHPYTHALITSTLDPEPEIRHHRLEGIQGAPPDLRYRPSGCPFHPRCPLVMDICSRQEPPSIGTEDHFAACWRVAEQATGETEKGAVR